MHILLTWLVIELAGHRVRLADLLGFQALTLQHIIEVCIAADVELHCPFQFYAAFAKEERQDAMDDGRPNLALNIVSNHGHMRLLEAFLPVGFARNKDWNTVNKADTCLENLLNVP